MPLSATLVAQLRATQTGAEAFGGPSFTPEMEALISLVDGVAAGQGNILYVKERTVGSGANDDLDLAGVLTDAFGSLVAAAEIVALFIINAPKSTTTANTTNLTLGGGTNPVAGYMGGTTPTIGPIRPGSFLFMGSRDIAGICAVAAGTADILRIANSAGASATYQIGIIARTS
jgi:hypothetical protein